MKQKAAVTRRSDCPISIALELLGDTWSLLIVRDMLFMGSTTYNDFLNAGEGIATNVLADRLQRLECGGIVEKNRDATDARKFIYGLTDKGLALAPVLLELILWSASHEQTAAPAVFVRQIKRDRASLLEDIKSRHRKK